MARLIPAIRHAPKSPRIEDDPRFRAMAAQVATLTAATRKQDRELFVAQALASGHLLPANKAAAAALMEQLQADDDARPLATGSRVDALKLMVAKMTPHRLTEDLMASPAGAVKAALAMTSLGRLALERTDD